LADLAVNHADVRAILEILAPYLRLVADYIPLAGPVNSEHAQAQFTVHGEPAFGGEAEADGANEPLVGSLSRADRRSTGGVE
jgi:hypothetical protein